MIRPSQHAIDALRIFYPKATGRTVIDEVEPEGAIKIPIEIVTSIMGRHSFRNNNESWYVLHSERTGIFVVHGVTVITFLRFYTLKQYDTMSSLYPGGAPVTANAHWVVAIEARKKLAQQQEQKKKEREEAEAYAQRQNGELAVQRREAFKAEKRAEGRAAGIQSAIKYLTSLGYTVIPPEGSGG